jgi:hypothetical protein
MEKGDLSREEFLKAEQQFYRDLHTKRQEVKRYKASLLEHEQALDLLIDLPKKVSLDCPRP